LLETLANGLLVSAQLALAPLLAWREQMLVEFLPGGVARKICTMKFRRAKPTSPSTFPLSFPLAGRPNLSANR
jgi:hypothetical protein